jgi:catechol 2,3-dioxygenase-like lactoylglutathione lyase family enzyme
MSAAPARLGAVTLFVTDVAVAKSWYETVFAAPVVFEDEQSVAFQFENTIVNLLRITEASELVAPATVAPADAGAQFQLTVWIDDADAAIARLAEFGVALLNGPIDRPWGQRTTCIADPDGHVWELAQTIG